MPWDRKRLLGYVETIQLILGVTDKMKYPVYAQNYIVPLFWDWVFHRQLLRSKKAKIKNRHDRVPHLTQDTTRESDKTQ